jgi:hypothetical protein
MSLGISIKEVTLETRGSLEEQKGVLPRGGIDKVQGKRKKTKFKMDGESEWKD